MHCAAFVQTQVYEHAAPYFELAATIQPQEPKWGLMAASCCRRIGAYPQALQRCVHSTRQPIQIRVIRVTLKRKLVANITDVGNQRVITDADKSYVLYRVKLKLGVAAGGGMGRVQRLIPGPAFSHPMC